jgi:Subtilase family
MTDPTLPDDDPLRTWAGRVSYSAQGGFAFRPNQVLVGVVGAQRADALRNAAGLLGDFFGVEVTPEADPDDPDSVRLVVGYGRLFGDFDVLAAVDVLRSDGRVAQPNHLTFAHCAGGGCGGPGGCPPHPAVVWSWARAHACRPDLGGNPFSGNPFSGNPFSGNPFSGNPWCGPIIGAGPCGIPFWGPPFWGSPFSGNPFSGNPFSGNPFSGNPFSGNSYTESSPVDPAGIDPTASPWAGSFAATGRRRSSARPADPLSVGPAHVPVDGDPIVYIVDTALPAGAERPPLLDECTTTRADPRLPVDGGADEDGDGYLDPVAGHSAFGAGLVAQVAAAVRMNVVVAMANLGDLDERTVAIALDALAGQADFVNLSFGGYTSMYMGQLAAAVLKVQTTPCPAAADSYSDAQSGAVIVASAGNDASCRPSYPAAFPGVVSVGALAPDGSPAPFTNYGSWVRACAPGVDLVSTFFADFDGREPATPGWGDSDRFRGWARWSGTSFAAPYVLAHLAREVNLTHCLPMQAVTRIIDATDAETIPGLGTIVR